MIQVLINFIVIGSYLFPLISSFFVLQVRVRDFTSLRLLYSVEVRHIDHLFTLSNSLYTFVDIYLVVCGLDIEAKFILSLLLEPCTLFGILARVLIMLDKSWVHISRYVHFPKCSGYRIPKIRVITFFFHELKS